jgi:predicted nucleotidyltransferase
MDIERIKQEIKQTTLGLEKKEILAVGLFGSIARGDFDEKSDIDIFVITEKELKLKEQDELYYIFSELIAKFKRDVTVLVYDINGIKNVPSWQTLNLLNDAHFLYDCGGIKEMFKSILEEAEKYGITYDNEEKVFKLKNIGRQIFSVK